MYEQCLTLSPFLTFNVITDIIGVALYFPWFSYMATWFLSTAFYDGNIFILNALVNYIWFAIFYSASRIIGVVSSAAIPCESLLFDSYRFLFPSPTYVTSMSYYWLLIIQHRRMRDEWWSNRHVISSGFFVVFMIAFPVSYMMALLYFGVMPWHLLLANNAISACLIFTLMEFSRTNKLWKGAAKTLNNFMDWAVRT